MGGISERSVAGRCLPGSQIEQPLDEGFGQKPEHAKSQDEEQHEGQCIDADQVPLSEQFGQDRVLGRAEEGRLHIHEGEDGEQEVEELMPVGRAWVFVVGGLLLSLLFGDGLSIRPSGIIGSILGAVVVTFLWMRFDPTKRAEAKTARRR